MLDFVLWTFAVAGFPMIVDLSGRFLTITGDALQWTSDHMIKPGRHGLPTSRRDPAHFSPSGRVVR